MLQQPLDVGEKLFTSRQRSADWKYLLTESYETDILDLVSIVLMDDHFVDEPSAEEDLDFLAKDPKSKSEQGDVLWQVLMNADPSVEKITSTDYSNSQEFLLQRQIPSESSSEIPSSSSGANTSTATSRGKAKVASSSATGNPELSPRRLPSRRSGGKRKRSSEGEENVKATTKICKMHRWTHQDVMQLIWFWCEASLEPTIEHGGTRVKKWKVINENFRVGRPWSSEARIQAYFKTKVKGLYNFRVIYNHMLKHNTVPDEYDATIYREKLPKT